MPTFCHSGTLGDILAALPVIRHMGGGELLIRLRNTTIPDRLNERDFEYIHPLIMKSGIVTNCRLYRPGERVDHDFDRFRDNLGRIFTSITGLHFIQMGFRDFPTNVALQRSVHLKPFLRVDNVRRIDGRYIGVSRTGRHRDGSPDLHEYWAAMVKGGLGEVGVFFGLPEEHRDFERTYRVTIPLVTTGTALETAEYIAGLECFACNATMNFWIASGLGKTTLLETRRKKSADTNAGSHIWGEEECNTGRPNLFAMPYKNWLHRLIEWPPPAL